MPNVFDAVGENRIFLNESLLSPEYLPDVLPGREKQIREMAETLKPFGLDRRVPPLLLYGPPGAGKTSCTRFVLKEFEEYSHKVACAYVNCWHHPTKQSVLAEACRSLGVVVPRRGLASDEVESTLFNQARRKNTILVLALDEVDRLFFKKEEGLLYDVLRAPIAIALIAITNDPVVFTKMDARIKSSFRPLSIEFPRYLPLELKSILHARADKAFRKNTCPNEAIGLCVAFASKKGGDARIALESLWLAGKNAEKRCAQKIDEIDCHEAFASQDKLHASQAKRLQGLTQIEQKILDLLDEPLYSVDLYDKLGLPERTGRRYLDALASKKLVAFENVVIGEGKRRLIRKLF